MKPPRLVLAPMEGVVDSITRELLTELGGIDLCVTEFIRVTNQLLPDSVLFRDAPEILTGSRTKSGTPLFVQFLGSDAECLADNAAKASSLGATGIDLNFGCPAKTVNRHDGGAVLLKDPDRLFQITEAVRRAVPAQIPVTAKIRLGVDNPQDCLINAEAISSAGASWLTVHCRTKAEMYRPPAHWEWLPLIRQRVLIPLIANGDIRDLSSFESCRRISGCESFMIGRAAIQNPWIFREILYNETSQPWARKLKFLVHFFELCQSRISSRFALARSKQWYQQFSLCSLEAKAGFDQIKVIGLPEDFLFRLKAQLLQVGGSESIP